MSRKTSRFGPMNLRDFALRAIFYVRSVIGRFMGRVRH
jgi:hypothetical protein